MMKENLSLQICNKNYFAFLFKVETDFSNENIM